MQQQRLTGRGGARRLLERTLPPRLRLPVLRWLAALMPSQVGPAGFEHLAAGFAARGDWRNAMRCWRLIQRMAPADPGILRRRLLCALDARDISEVGAVVEDAAQGPAVSPQLSAWLAGTVAARGYGEVAGRVLAGLAKTPGGGGRAVQSPSIVSAGVPVDLRAFAETLASTGSAFDRDTTLGLARLCFTFRAFEPAAALYRQASEADGLGPEDQLAMLYAAVESGHGQPSASGVAPGNLLATVRGNTDALGMLAKAALHAGDAAAAHEAVGLALRDRFGSSPHLSAIAADCAAIVDVLAALRAVDERIPPELVQEQPAGMGIPKVFLCGFGWSGSGAVYDEIRGVPGFCEFEGAGRDAIINEDADSEVMFVQGAGGLGDLWLRAREGRVSWRLLWDTFGLHVAGLSPVGYGGYKSCAAARNNVLEHGADYTGPFRRFFEGYLELRRNPRPAGLHSQLIETTEALCAMLTRRTGGKVVLFNNAVFGRHPAMLEIFRSGRVAVVYRDPRDVYVDRRGQDRNHWRSPAQLAAFYAGSLDAYARYRSRGGGGRSDFREVPFERFVLDDAFRARVRAWLTGGLDDANAPGCFDPLASRRNIGIHHGVLADGELAQLQATLAAHRELDRLSAASWAPSPLRRFA